MQEFGVGLGRVRGLENSLGKEGGEKAMLKKHSSGGGGSFWRTKEGESSLPFPLLLLIRNSVIKTSPPLTAALSPPIHPHSYPRRKK